jgi:hypothetical protein
MIKETLKEQREWQRDFVEGFYERSKLSAKIYESRIAELWERVHKTERNLEIAKKYIPTKSMVAFWEEVNGQ